MKKLPEIECSKCKEVINREGRCECKPPYGNMPGEEYTARFIYPVMVLNSPNKYS